MPDPVHPIRRYGRAARAGATPRRHAARARHHRCLSVRRGRGHAVGDLNAFFLLVDEPNVYNLPDKPHLPQAQVIPAYVATVITGVMLGVATLLALGGGAGRGRR